MTFWEKFFILDAMNFNQIMTERKICINTNELWVRGEKRTKNVDQNLFRKVIFNKHESRFIYKKPNCQTPDASNRNHFSLVLFALSYGVSCSWKLITVAHANNKLLAIIYSPRKNERMKESSEPKTILKEKRKKEKRERKARKCNWVII